MHRSLNRYNLILMTVIVFLLLHPLPASSQGDDPPVKQTKTLHKRIDFSTAHILGQSIKSGAVYLMHRKKSDIKNMLQVRDNYRAEIMEDYGLEDTAIAPRNTEQSENQRK
jgi:hypothetical protein